MSNKKHSKVNVPMIKTEDAEGRLVIDSRGIQSTFDNEGTLTFNGNNGVLTWNSGDLTHLNFTSNDNFMIMFDAESGLLTLTFNGKNIFYNLDDLGKEIEKIGYTAEQLEKILEEKNEKTSSDSGHAE